MRHLHYLVCLVLLFSLSLTLPAMSFAECTSCPATFSPSPDGNTWNLIGGSPATGCTYGGWFSSEDFNCATVSGTGDTLTGMAYHYCQTNGTGGTPWGGTSLSCSGGSTGGGGGGLTPEQLAAIQAVLDALSDAQGYGDSATSGLSSLNALYGSLSSLQNSLNDYLGQLSGAVTTITNSLNLIGAYLQQGQALGPQAAEMIASQVAEAALQRGIADDINLSTQGVACNDPVLVASGIESFKIEDFSYKVLNDVIKITRQYRSNQTELESSFGRSWFFNYDTNIIAGRKPFIREREILTAELKAQAETLAAQAVAELNKAMNSLVAARTAAVNAQATAQALSSASGDVGSQAAEIEGDAASAEAAAELAAQQAAIAGTSEAQADADEAQTIANAARQAANEAAANATSASGIVSSAQTAANTAAGSVNAAESKVASISSYNDAIQVIVAERTIEAAEAAAEARLEEATYPDDPYPTDPTIYFGPGFVKLITETGTPVLFEEQESGEFIPVTDNSSYTDTIVRTDTGHKLVDKHGATKEFVHNNKGIYLLSKAVDTNNNSTVFTRVDEKLIQITDSVGRITTLTYTPQGFISTIQDPLGNEYQYSYDGGKLVSYIDPMGYTWSYGYDEQARMISRIDPKGNAYQYVYDALDRVVSEIDKSGFAFSYSYDPENRVTTSTDRNGGVTKYYYNTEHRLERTVYPDGAEVSNAYDGRNNIIAVNDENGDISIFTYNEFNDLASVTNALGERTVITYESVFNKVASVTDPLGHTRSFTYDNQGNLITVIHPDGSTRSMSYNSLGLPVGVTDENGNTTGLGYDQYGQLASITHPDGAVKELVADELGRIIAQTDENGFTSELTYNALNKVIATLDPLGAETSFQYDELQRKIGKSDAKGNQYSYEYSVRGNLIRSIDPLGNVEQRNYDAEENLIAKTFPNGTGMNYAYDSRNRKTRTTTFPGNLETIVSYDLKGQKIAKQDANGNTTGYQYDTAGRVVAEIDALGNTTSSVYDGAGNLLQVIDANGNAISYSYDVLNRMVQTTNALGNTTAFTYDPAGNLTQKQKPDGSIITHSYDSRHRLVETVYPDGTNKVFGYDNVGRMTSMANAETDEVRAYDGMGRLLAVSDKYNGQIDYAYDILGNRTEVIDPANGVMSYVYDAKNRVTGFTDPEGNQTTFTYDTMGRVVQVSHPNDTETTQVYNEQNRLVSTATTGDHEGVLSSFSYTHDSVGNRLSMTEEDGNITTYQYDELNRLIHVDYPQRDWEPILTDMEKNNGTLMGKGNKKGHFKKNPCDSETCLPSAVSYQYDAVGNRLSHTDDWQTVAYQYNQANQMLAAGTAQFTYDVNGNRISKVEDGDAAHYTYNYDDLMVQVDSPNSESTGYGYDALNRRIYKVNQDGDTTDYLYDGIEVLQEITGNLEQKIATYYRVNGRILTRQEFNVAQGTDKYLNRPTGRQLYYTYDGLGSVASISNHQGVLQSRYHYDAFGKIEEGDITENPYGFAGKRFDEETGMYKFHFRSYDPVTGVWATPDPIGILGGVNFYAYVKNNPVKWIDPLGLELEEGDDGFNDQGWGGDSGVDAEENGFQGDLGDYGDRDGGKGTPYNLPTFVTQAAAIADIVWTIATSPINAYSIISIYADAWSANTANQGNVFAKTLNYSASTAGVLAAYMGTSRFGIAVSAFALGYSIGTDINDVIENYSNNEKECDR